MRRSSARINSESKLGDCNRIFAGTIRNVNAAFRSCGNVDRVVAGARAHDQFIGPAASIGSVTFVPLTTSTSGDTWRIALSKSVVFQIRLIGNVATEGLQAIESGLFKFVSY